MSDLVLAAGPELPRSSWPLEGVPGTILDVIVDHVAQQARQDHVRVHVLEPKWGLDKLYEKSEDPNVVAFTPNVKALSMVDRFFRHNVLSRKIFNTLEVGSCEDIVELVEKVQRHSLLAVRSILFLATPTSRENGTDRKKTLDALTLQRNKLFLACPNAEHVVDFSGYLARAKHYYPRSLTRIHLELASKGYEGPISADSLPGSLVGLSALNAPGLQILEIDLEDDRFMGYADLLTPVAFGPVIAKLLQGCEELDKLSLQLPDLPMDWYPGRHIPEELRFPDPLVGTLKRVGTLHLDLPLGTVGLGSEKRPLWWSYLKRIGPTSVEYTRLHICMTWSPDLDLVVDPTTQDILAMMGLAKLSLRKSDNKPYVPPDDCVSDEFCSLFGPLLLVRPELEEIEVAWLVEPPTALNRTVQLDLYRLVTVTREHAAGYGKRRTAYCEHILNEVVDKIIKEFCSRPSGSPTPVAANFDPATMPSGLPPHLASPVATATDDVMASVDPAVGPDTQPGEAEWEELD